MKRVKNFITHNLINIPGWRTNRKIVVIESDDWGSIRMPSKKIFDELLRKGIRVDKDSYCKFDTLASQEDLEALFEVLTSVKDKNGQNAVLTANTVVTNPDFDKIEASGFNEYFNEPFTNTLKRYYPDHRVFALWEQGMDENIFHPQFHGREHLNIKKWMNVLLSGEEVTRMAFNLRTFGLSSDVDDRIKTNYMGAFNSGTAEDIEKNKQSIKEGLDLFERIFGYRSLTFIPTTYTWPTEIEYELKNDGVKYLQGMIHQRIPLDCDSTFTYKKNNYLGNKSCSGLVYLMRNCYFEPSQRPDFNWTEDCFNRVKIAFRWKKPATISVHRLNFIGSINEDNRKNNLKDLKQLLCKIVDRFPEVEFMSSDKLAELIKFE